MIGHRMAEHVTTRTVVPSTTVVAVTEFTCADLATFVSLWLRFRWHSSAITRAAAGLVGTWTAVDWRARRIVNISLWTTKESLYSLGRSRPHIQNARWALKRGGIQTASLLFGALGDWRDVLWREPLRARPERQIDRREDHE